MGYKKLIFVHLIEKINLVPKIANLITRRKKFLTVCCVDSSDETIDDRLFIH